ncbi:aldo-keto reductase family 1 member A1-like [Thrips palmi]|uniref:Aldo-keto reductase family 1 member A1-like n=1 Tax=Thrips palmi TaxID=161013 RepID=A0A6P8YXI0_THRPL|nr:aldo-keto reductase family 1 member A1-like [Thrips palmi]
MPSKTYATLHTGAKMPLLGYGTWQAVEGQLEGALHAALEAGYRHIDTAAAYRNEEAIGQVLKEWMDSGKVKREDLFIVTKLPAAGIRPSGPKKWLSDSLRKLGLDYVDLYLAHCPFCAKESPDDSPFPIGPDGKMKFESDTDHVGMWKAMEAEVHAGRAKAIGLSNYNKRLIQKVLDNCTIKPANLQVELHVYMQQKPLVDFCHQNGITVCAYSPIGSPGSENFVKNFGITLPDLIKNPTIVEVAQKHKKTPGQVLLKHIVQRGIIAIPKSLSKERIQQNIALFDWELSTVDMAKIDALDQGKAGRIFDMAFLGLDRSHPAYPFGEYP